jgi:type I restriction enzyme S subunit
MAKINKIPNGWEVCDFAKTLTKCGIGKNHQINNSEICLTGKYPVIDQSQDYIAGYSDKAEKVYSPKQPLVIFGDHTRCFKFVDFPFIIGADGTKVLSPNTDLFNPKYYYFYLLSLNVPSRGYCRHFKLLKEQKVLRPSLIEQHNIACILSKIQNAMETQKKIIQTTTELKNALMQKLFTKGLKDEAQKKTEIGLVPKSWDIKSLADIGEDFIGGGTPSTRIKDYWGGDIFWTTSKRLNGSIYLTEGEKKITKLGLDNSSTSLVPKNNLIISTRVTVGKVAINTIDISISQDLTAVLVDKDKYDLKFLAYQLKAGRIQNIFEVQKRGATIKGIAREDLKKIKLTIPEINVQKNISQVLDTTDKRIRAAFSKKEALENLFNSTLHYLMIGQGRVKDIKFS